MLAQLIGSAVSRSPTWRYPDVVRRRATTLAITGLVALTAVLMVFAGSATAASPNGLVLVTEEPTASPTATLDPNATPCGNS